MNPTMVEEVQVRVAPLLSPLLPALVPVPLSRAVSLLSPALSKCCLSPPGARQGSPSSAARAPSAASQSLAGIANSLLVLDLQSWFGLVFNSNI